MLAPALQSQASPDDTLFVFARPTLGSRMPVALLRKKVRDLPLAAPLLARAPRGDGHPVLVLPGLAAGDRSTYPIRRYLDRLGYAAYKWDQGLNFGPRDHVIKGLVEKVRQMQFEHDQKVSIVGWSTPGQWLKSSTQ